MRKVGRTSRMAASACQPTPSVKARLCSDGLNTDGASQCSGKSTNIPTKLVPMTMVRICTSPNTASAAAKPVSMPAASGTVRQNTRALRNTHSSRVKVSSKPAALIKRLSLLAAALDAAAYTAPPALKVSAPALAACSRLCCSSGSKSSLPLAILLVCGSLPRSHTQVLPASSSVNNIPLSAFHCKRLCGCALSPTKRPKPSQSCSNDKGDGAANGFTAASARCRKYCCGSSNNCCRCSRGSTAKPKRCISPRTCSKSGEILLSTSANTPLLRHKSAISAAA